MFKSAEARYALRTCLVGLAAAVPLLIAGEDWKQIVGSGILAALAYAGIGAATPQVEPFIGKKLEPPPVPPEGEQL